MPLHRRPGGDARSRRPGREAPRRASRPRPPASPRGCSARIPPCAARSPTTRESTACSSGRNTLTSTARRIERADERDDEQRPEIGDEGEAQPVAGHQHAGREQQRPVVESGTRAGRPQRHHARAEQRRRRDDRRPAAGESELEQVDRQEQAHVAVAECAQRLGNENAADLRCAPTSELRPAVIDRKRTVTSRRTP